MQAGRKYMESIKWKSTAKTGETIVFWHMTHIEWIPLRVHGVYVFWNHPSLKPSSCLCDDIPNRPWLSYRNHCKYHISRHAWWENNDTKCCLLREQSLSAWSMPFQEASQRDRLKSQDMKRRGRNPCQYGNNGTTQIKTEGKGSKYSGQIYVLVLLGLLLRRTVLTHNLIKNQSWLGRLQTRTCASFQAISKTQAAANWQMKEFKSFSGHIKYWTAWCEVIITLDASHALW